MKKTILFMLAGLWVFTTVSAQGNGNIYSRPADGPYDAGRSGFGVRAGVNVSDVTGFGSQTGFHVGGSYDVQLSGFAPVYFETGLYLQYKGARRTFNGALERLDLWYLEVPALLNYRVRLGPNWTVQPFVGFYYALGVGSKFEPFSAGDSIFGNMIKRSDLGIRMGVGATWKHLYFGLGYDGGLLDIAKSGWTERESVKTNSFYLSVGYNF